MHQYRFKRSFSEDATLSSRLFNLLESTFAGISRTAESARALSAPCEEASTPFVRFEGDRAIAHVGVLELPMVVMGQSMIVGGIHAVCTRPKFRHRR